MKNTYVFGIIAAILVVVLGVVLLNRDGTEEEKEPVLTTDSAVIDTSNLPINEEADTEESTEEPVLESEEDASASQEPQELPESDETATSSEEVIVSDTTVINYTDAGFSPKTISIEQGATVSFINNSSRNMWVASNVHPTHNEYPEESDGDCLGSSFDSCIGVAPGESWSFTFNSTGEWGYHDHLKASRTGTIIVE